jgi:hypothetical protein
MDVETRGEGVACGKAAEDVGVPEEHQKMNRLALQLGGWTELRESAWFKPPYIYRHQHRFHSVVLHSLFEESLIEASRYVKICPR